MVTHPSYSTEKRREYQRTYRAAGRDASYVDKRMLPFVGVDGEGGNLANGYHAYFLLRAGDSFIVPRQGAVRLSTRECLQFLDGLPRDRVYVVYFGDYDVTKWLEDLGWSRLEKLLDRSKRMRSDGKGVWPVDYEDFQVDYLPRKEFKVRRIKSRYVDPVSGKTKREYTPWLIVNDVGSFFQCRFVEALQKWGVGSDSDVAAIGQGKEARDSFDFADIEWIAKYNLYEVQNLAELMEKFRQACITTGYVPAKWQGPGQLAEAMLAKHGVPRSKDVQLLQDPAYDSLMTYARNAFYGGRPEITVVGPVDRPVWQFDINSAYPFAMTKLPCLEHGRWEFVDGVAWAGGNMWGSLSGIDTSSQSKGGIGGQPECAILFGSFEPERASGRKRPRLYGLPIRSKEGSICYPGAGRGWYWDFEVRSAIHQCFSVEGSWVYFRDCACKPLGFVPDVYRSRKELGKDEAGIVLKLALNSLYGKQVQSVGNPRYANPIWGSFITAYCRAMIQDFIHASEWCQDPDRTCGLDVLMIATDSVCTWNERTDVVESGDLGGWSRETHPRGMFIVQPGLYFGSSSKPAKTRGVPRSVIESYLPTFQSAFNDMVSSHRLNAGDVDVPQRMFVGIRYALHRRNLKLLGQWIEFVDPESGRTGKRISFDWSTKRLPYPALDPLPGLRSWIETLPQSGSVDVETLPYSRDIGGLLRREEFRLAFADAPDWADALEVGSLDA